MSRAVWILYRRVCFGDGNQDRGDVQRVLRRSVAGNVVLMVSMLLYPLIAGAYWLSDQLIILFGTRLLHGLTSAMLLPLATMGVRPEGQEARYMGMYNATFFLAKGVGPIVGAKVRER